MGGGVNGLARRLLLADDRLEGAIAGALDHLHQPPALGRRQRARLLDTHPVADARLVRIVMRLELRGQPDDPLVQRMAGQPFDGHHDGLVHLVRDDPADLLLALAAQLLGVHRLPPPAAPAATGCRSSRSSRSVTTVSRRAIVRRVRVSWVWSVSWRVASWKRRSYRCRRWVTSSASSSASVRARTLSMSIATGSFANQ